MSERTGWPTEGDYAWASGWGDAFCLALIEGGQPEVVLERMVVDPPTGVIPVDQAREWAEAENATWVKTQSLPLYATTIEAGIAGGWAITIEPNGFLATHPEVIGRLSQGSRAVAVFRNVNAVMSFTYAVDGEVVRVFDPLLYPDPDPRSGPTLPEESGLPFGLANPTGCALACAERITGLRLTEEMLENRDGWVAVGHYPAYSGPDARSWREARAEAERRAELELEQLQELLEAREVRDRWGGQAPSDRLRHVAANVQGLAELDRDLLDALDQADPAVQRAIAHWGAGRALIRAGLADLDWVAPALEDLQAGRPLPPPFDDVVPPFEFLRGDKHLVIGSVITSSQRDAPAARNVDPRYAALPALRDATAPDPLQAAINVLFAAALAFGDEYPRLFEEVRQTFRV